MADAAARPAKIKTGMILPCDCAVAGTIRVKCGASKDKQETEAPWHTRGNAAKAQDAMYGKGNRLHNRSQKKDENKARCTVCGRAKAL